MWACLVSMSLRCASAPETEADRWALAQLRAKAETGDAQSQAEFAAACFFGKFGLATNYVEAAKWWRKAAEQNIAPAQYNPGGMCAAAKAVPRDMAGALKWWRKAADQSHVKAQDNLGRIYMRGDRVPQDFVEAYKCFLLAGAQGYAVNMAFT